jgi:hypothetical protein
MVDTQEGSRGRLQGKSLKAVHNLHFTRLAMTMTTMGVPLVTTFEVEVIDPKSKYKRRQAIRKLEKLMQLPKGRALKVVDLPHKDKPSSSMTFHPSQHWKNGWIEGEDNYYHQIVRREYMDKGPPSLKEKWILMTCLMQLFLSNATFFVPCN